MNRKNNIHTSAKHPVKFQNPEMRSWRALFIIIILILAVFFSLFVSENPINNNPIKFLNIDEGSLFFISFVLLSLIVFSLYSIASIRYSFRYRKKEYLTDLYMTHLTRHEIISGLIHRQKMFFFLFIYPLLILLITIFSLFVFYSTDLIILSTTFPILVYFIINKSWLVCRSNIIRFITYSLFWSTIIFCSIIFLDKIVDILNLKIIPANLVLVYLYILFPFYSVIWYQYSMFGEETFFINCGIDDDSSSHLLKLEFLFWKSLFGKLFFWLDVETDPRLRKNYFKAMDLFMAAAFVNIAAFFKFFFTFNYYLYEFGYKYYLPQYFVSKGFYDFLAIPVYAMSIFAAACLVLEVLNILKSMYILIGLITGILISLWLNIRMIDCFLHPLQLLNIPVLLTFMMSFRRYVNNNKFRIPFNRILTVFFYAVIAYFIYKYGENLLSWF